MSTYSFVFRTKKNIKEFNPLYKGNLISTLHGRFHYLEFEHIYNCTSEEDVRFYIKRHIKEISEKYEINHKNISIFVFENGYPGKFKTSNKKIDIVNISTQDIQEYLKIRSEIKHLSNSMNLKVFSRNGRSFVLYIKNMPSESLLDTCQKFMANFNCYASCMAKRIILEKV